MSKYEYGPIMELAPKLGFSHSSINDFETCPRKFWLSKNPATKDLGEGDTGARDTGGAAHDFAEAYQKARNNGAVIAAQIKNFETVAVKKHSLSETNEKDLGFMCRYFVKEQPFTVSPDAMIECKLALGENLVPGAWFSNNNYRAYARGVLDRADFTELNSKGEPVAVHITDWKTNRKPIVSEIQGKLYCWFLKEHYPTLEKFKVTFWFFRGHTPKVFEYAVSDTEDAKQWFISKAKKIEACTFFEATPNHLCDYCDFSHMCDAWAAQNTSTPQGRLRALCAADAFAKAMKRKVKDDLKGASEIATGNTKAIMVDGGQSRTMDVFGFVNVMKIAEGIDDELDAWKASAPYLRLDMQAKPVKELLDDPELKEAIDEVSTFKQRAAKLEIVTLDSEKKAVEVAPDPILSETVTTLDEAKKAIEKLRKKAGLDTNHKNGLLRGLCGEGVNSVRSLKDLEKAKGVLAFIEVNTKEDLLAAAQRGMDLLKGKDVSELGEVKQDHREAFYAAIDERKLGAYHLSLIAKKMIDGFKTLDELNDEDFALLEAFVTEKTNDELLALIADGVAIKKPATSDDLIEKIEALREKMNDEGVWAAILEDFGVNADGWQNLSASTLDRLRAEVQGNCY